MTYKIGQTFCFANWVLNKGVIVWEWVKFLPDKFCHAPYHRFHFAELEGFVDDEK